MQAEIPAEMTLFVERMIAQGRYTDSSEVLVESLRLLESREKLRQDVREGFAQLDRGEGIDAETVYRDVEKRIRQIEREQSAD